MPVGRLMPEDAIYTREQGSIIILVATDAPLLPVQLQRVARRATLGMARTGTVGGDGSGDIFLAFSTAGRADETSLDPLPSLAYAPNDRIDPIFEATVEAVEEAILNAQNGDPEPIVLVGAVEASLYAVVEISSASSFAPANGPPESATINFTIQGGTHTAAYQDLSPGGAFPSGLATVSKHDVLLFYKLVFMNQHDGII